MCQLRADAVNVIEARNNVHIHVPPRSTTDFFEVTDVMAWAYYLLNTQLMQDNNTKHINHNIKAIKDYHVDS